MCSSLGFELASVRNAYENELINRFVHREDPTPDPQGFPWMGLIHDGTASWDEAKWSDGSRMRYTNWARNEPSNYPVRCNIP